MGFLNVAVSSLATVGFLSIVYRLLPHRELSNKKPSVAFFPKYAVPIDKDKVLPILETSGFKKHKGTDTFVRGYALGDFLASLARLNVVIKGNTAFLHAPLIAILFDTGDLWEIAREIQKASETNLLFLHGPSNTAQSVLEKLPFIVCFLEHDQPR